MADHTLDLQVQEFNLGTLTTNAQAILAGVKEKLAGYKIENYSGDRIAEAKNDKAELNAAATRLNASRLEYERLWMQPFEAGFKDIIDEACKEIKKASGAIDALVKDVERQEKEAKGDEIAEHFDTLGFSLVTLDQIFDPSWLNKTVKMPAIREAIRLRIEKIGSDLAILDKIGEPEARTLYLQSLDLNDAMKRADRIKKDREILEANDKARREREEEDRKARAERLVQNITEGPAPVDEKLVVGAAIDLDFGVSGIVETTARPLDLMEYRLVVKGTKEALRLLRTFMDDNGIEYAKIPDLAEPPY